MVFLSSVPQRRRVLFPLLSFKPFFAIPFLLTILEILMPFFDDCSCRYSIPKFSFSEAWEQDHQAGVRTVSKGSPSGPKVDCCASKSAHPKTITSLLASYYHHRMMHSRRNVISIYVGSRITKQVR